MLKSQMAKSWKLILTERLGEDFVRGTEWGTKSGGGVIVSTYMQDGITWCRTKFDQTPSWICLWDCPKMSVVLTRAGKNDHH